MSTFPFPPGDPLAPGRVSGCRVESVRCGDCYVAPGEEHVGGCDVERCTVCGGQWIDCGHEAHDPDLARWTGGL